MLKITEEAQAQAIFLFSFFVAILSLTIVFVLIGCEVYVRWNTNQDFTFLGGNSLPALIISAFVLLLGLAHIHRPK